jgi:hypothetical protein
LSTTTRSPAARPFRTSQFAPLQPPVCTGRIWALFSASRTKRKYPFSFCDTADCGTRKALRYSPAVMRTRTNCPGSRRTLGLSNSARNSWVAMRESICVAAKLRWPCSG